MWVIAVLPFLLSFILALGWAYAEDIWRLGQSVRRYFCVRFLRPLEGFAFSGIDLTSTDPPQFGGDLGPALSAFVRGAGGLLVGFAIPPRFGRRCTRGTTSTSPSSVPTRPQDLARLCTSGLRRPAAPRTMPLPRPRPRWLGSAAAAALWLPAASAAPVLPSAFMWFATTPGDTDRTIAAGESCLP